MRACYDEHGSLICQGCGCGLKLADEFLTGYVAVCIGCGEGCRRDEMPTLRAIENGQTVIHHRRRTTERDDQSL